MEYDGGPYCRPKHWKRNTAFAMAGIVLICIPIAMKSAELEIRIKGFVNSDRKRILEKSLKSAEHRLVKLLF
ncbi:hypothetical protein Sango_2624700 [Sesamum angolense]|uniref:Uncharacterized protein n=1 Tax=Sesamum angolense TaxID=2727404 RepID=A0AAE2BGH0_9LAMI|nr:hypothetical protein Sango_2624700 [Sesamum angolense]